MWFTSLGLGARRLAGLFASPLTWRILDGLIAVTMIGLGSRWRCPDRMLAATAATAAIDDAPAATATATATGPTGPGRLLSGRFGGRSGRSMSINSRHHPCSCKRTGT